MKSFLPLLLCFLFKMELSAQNLVFNGSFEEVFSCPPGWNAIDTCVGWFSEAGSPDAIASCSPYPVSVPNNFCGFQFPFEGYNYAGLVTFASYFGDFPVREIIGTKLIDSLVIGNTYYFSMRVCQAYNEANGIIVSTNNLGAKFSMKHHTDYAFAHDNLPQLYEDSIITDSINWLLLHWNFVADSAYQYVYIGNFFDNDHTDTLNAGQPFLLAYYYVDSVNLFCIDPNCEATEISDPSNYKEFIIYDEVSGNISFHLNGIETAEFYLINILGEKLFQVTVMDNFEIPLQYLQRGIYIAYLKTKNRSLVKKISIH